MRGTNLTLLSYSSKRASSTLDIPLPILGIIVGLGFLMSGILLFVVKPNTEVAAVEVPDKITSIVTPQEITAAQTAVALAPVRRPLQTQNVETNKAPSKDVPLVFDHEPQIVPIQIQACVQQALFNLDRHFKNSAIVINKEFVAVGSVTLDYPKFIKIFENILLNLHQELAGSAKKKIYIRSYDKDSNIFLEFQAPVARFNLPDLIITELTKVGAEYSLTNSSAGDPVVKFIFARSPVVTESVKAAGFATPTAEALSGNLNITAQSGVDLEKIAQPDSDLDIDALLSLDDEAETGAPVEVDSNLKLDLAKEMQPTKFKLEDKLSIVEDPELNVELAARAQADQIKVKIRRPEKG